MADLQASCNRLFAQQSSSFQRASSAELRIVGSPVITPLQVMISFSCRGMVNNLKRVRRQDLTCLALDGKMKICEGRYIILTMGQLTLAGTASYTTLCNVSGDQRKHQGKCRTATFRPWMQALVDSEHQDSCEKAFQELIALGKAEAGLNLTTQVAQMQRDASGALEAARRHTFPCSRPVSDYAHVMRVCGTQLHKKCSTRGVRNRCLTFLRVCRFLPTIDLFDAVVQVFLSSLRTADELETAAYLEKTLFQTVSVPVLKRLFTAATSAWGFPNMFFAGFWAGACGTLRGTASGTQALEAFHSCWEQLLKHKLRSGVVDIFQEMQNMYLQWEQQKWFASDPEPPKTDPQKWDQLFLNSDTFRRTGHHCAVDFWAAKELGNRREIRVADCTFIVLPLASSRLEVTVQVATSLVKLLTDTGSALAQTLVDTGVVSGRAEDNTWALHLSVLEQLFSKHCVVFTGEFASKCSSRLFNRLDATDRFCTCPNYGIRAQCPHVIYVAALAGEVALDLLPRQTVLGRRRKTTEEGTEEPESSTVSQQRQAEVALRDIDDIPLIELGSAECRGLISG